MKRKGNITRFADYLALVAAGVHRDRRGGGPRCADAARPRDGGGDAPAVDERGRGGAGREERSSRMSGDDTKALPAPDGSDEIEASRAPLLEHLIDVLHESGHLFGEPGNDVVLGLREVLVKEMAQRPRIAGRLMGSGFHLLCRLGGGALLGAAAQLLGQSFVQFRNPLDMGEVDTATRNQIRQDGTTEIC